MGLLTMSAQTAWSSQSISWVFWIGSAKIPAGVPDDLDGLEDQEVILGSAHLVGLVHVQHKAQLTILIEDPVVAGEMDGG